MTQPLTPKELSDLFQTIDNEPTGKLSKLAEVAGLSLAKDYIGVNLSGADLSNDNLSKANLNDSNLTNVNLSFTNLSEASLRGAKLSNANLSNTNLSHADLSHADLSHANLFRTNFSHANLTNVNFQEASIQEVNIENVEGLTETQTIELGLNKKILPLMANSNYASMIFNSFEDIQTTWEEAENERNQGNLLRAYDIYRNLLEQRLISGAEFIAADTTIIQALSDMTILFGQFQAADDLLNGLVGLYKNANNYPLVYFTIIKRTLLALDRGLLSQADDLLHSLSLQIGDIKNIDISPTGLVQWEASCLWNIADRDDQIVLFAHLYLAMGRLLCALGQYSDALVMLNRGLFYTKADAPSLARQTALPLKFAIAAAHLEKGELETAKTNLTNLQTQFDDNQQPEALIRWLELSGKINLLQGQFGEALEKFKLVEEECRKLGIRRAAVQATLNLAYVLIPLNQTSSAKDYLNAALNDAKELQDEELLQRTRLLSSLADARGISLASESLVGRSVSEMQKGQHNSNLTLEEDEENELFFTTQSANYLALFDDRVLEFYWVLSYLGLTRANQKLSDIQYAFKNSDSKLIKIRIKILEGISAYYHGVEYQDREQICWAATILDETRSPLQELNLKPELWQVQQFLGFCYNRLNYSHEIQENLSKENDLLLKELSNTLPPEDQAIYLLNKWTADEKKFAHIINEIQRFQVQKLVNRSIFVRLWRQWKLMQRLLNLLEHIDRYKDVLAKRIIQDRNESGEFITSSSLLHRLLTHPRNRITLSFLVLPDQILVIRLGWLMLDFWVLSKTRLELRNIVQGWHQTLQGINRSRDISSRPEEDDELVRDSVAQKSQEISSRISELLNFSFFLKGLPKRIKAITIVPDDILHGFPFATLTYQGKYLIEKYAISINYESKNKQLSKSPLSKQNQVLLVGVSQGTNKFAPLPGVTKELNEVYQWFKKNQFKDENIAQLIDNFARKEAVLAQLVEANFLHISCHGIFEYNRPDRSGLVLISEEQQPEILSLRELSNLNLSQLHHVTLSSCWSADHFILPGRWIISLPETLWRSGVHSILGCLWEVNDHLAVLFMTRFYKHLEKLPFDRALQQTQLECLNGRLPNSESIDLTNPIFWAGFTLYGTLI